MNKRKLLSIILLVLAVLSFVMFFVSRSNQQYTIIFDSNGGSIVNNQKVKYHQKVVKPSNPSRDNYKFLGWYSDGNLYNFDNLIEKNILLVASWEENKKYIVTITLEKSGYEASFYENAVLNLGSFLLPPKNGYKIVLYNNDKLYNINTPITSNLNLIAKYEKNS